MKKLVFLLKLSILAVLLILSGSVFGYYSKITELSDTTEPTVFIVETGDSFSRVAYKLKKAGLINSPTLLKIAGYVKGKSTALKTGEYTIPAHASASEILDILSQGKSALRRITIPEGKTSAQIYDILLSVDSMSGELPELPKNGTLLPETYTYSYGFPRNIILDRMKNALTKTLDELWETRDDDLPYLNKYEVLIMASIIEKETALASERPHIASVFINRLRKGMRLQTDPTVIYAVTNGTMELKRKLTLEDLRTPHPFNTYTTKGLPPAPICNPGRDSINAALHPMITKDLYFVADGTGGHSFSESFDAHKRNISSWKRTLKKQRMEKVRQRKQLMLAKKRELLKKEKEAKLAGLKEKQNKASEIALNPNEKEIVPMLETLDENTELLEDNIPNATVLSIDDDQLDKLIQ
ncbi:MAG: endolytic transglycosylase MltG [Alphaproteobacteria bacterium]|nr:endolytic transglycosylase MltG [Alphaproteobacteria bacterium]